MLFSLNSMFTPTIACCNQPLLTLFFKKKLRYKPNRLQTLPSYLPHTDKIQLMIS